MKPVIIGAGLAGLTTALALAPMPIILLSSRKLGKASSSSWAQGGVAAAIGEDDAADLHAADTIKAGAGLTNAAVAQTVTADAASVIARLIKQGVVFDRDQAGHLRLGLEGAHGRRRIVHAYGDGTGMAIMQALIKAARSTPSIEIMEDTTALSILADDTVRGVTIMRDGEPAFIPAHQVVLATGGAGALWKHTTNPLQSWGHGIALAAKAGAKLANLEFMQFHPTAFDIGRDPMPLASEALRGEGAVLVDESQARFVDELASRDNVARTIAKHIGQGHKVFLDARGALGDDFAIRFPAIYALCRSANIDPAIEPIPVCPAAHYHMGGVMTDGKGQTSVKGLWACGEVAHTGLHGANRLASNSLLEAASFGQRVADDIKGSAPAIQAVRMPNVQVAKANNDTNFEQVREVMSRYVGVVRDGEGLETALMRLSPLAPNSNAALVATLITASALKRKESRGAHTRKDYADLLPEAEISTLVLGDILPRLNIKLSLAAGA